MCRTMRTVSISSSRSVAIFATASTSYGKAKIAAYTESMIGSVTGRSFSAVRNQCSPV